MSSRGRAGGRPCATTRDRGRTRNREETGTRGGETADRGVKRATRSRTRTQTDRGREENRASPEEKKARTGHHRVRAASTTLRPVEPAAHTPRAATAAATDSQEQEKATRDDVQREVQTFIDAMRNQNTRAAYILQWRMFSEWVRTIANPKRAECAQIDLERPTEWDVAQYCKYVVIERGNAISTANSALAAIKDHLALLETPDYHPWRGTVIKQMMATLTPLATPVTQKKELTSTDITRIVNAALKANTLTATRDACMILIAYHTLQRASEVVRLNRGDITFTEDMVNNQTRNVMRVHVDRLSKNDTKRIGHERLVLERDSQPERCAVQILRSYLEHQRDKSASAPLFPRDNGGRMSAATPNHRLRHWLEVAGVPNPEEYGFHSLRAGGASDAARSGVHERDIKAHGNWKSDVVRSYIRPTLEDRLATSAALTRLE